MKTGRQRGFLLLEVLIAGLILTASIASVMYLFRTGFENLERVDRVNLLSEKLLQAGSLLKVIDLEKQSGTEDLGDGVAMKWSSHLLARPKDYRYGVSPHGEGLIRIYYSHALFLYRVDFSLNFQGTIKDYQTNVFRSRPHTWR